MKRNGLNVVKVLTTVFAAAVMFACVSTTSLAYTETEGKITVDTAKIRESADTGSSVKGMVDKGATVTIIDETTDSSGTLWYQVKTSDATGYIRSDLLEKGQPIASDNGDGSDAGASDAAVETSADGVSAMASQYAQVAVDSGKLRADASTKDSIVVTMNKGDQVIVDGQKTGSDGKTWYHVSFVGNDGSAYDGFMRNDLVTLGDMVAVEEPVEETPAEEENVEESVAEPVVSQDYETVYTDDGTGNNVWYLYDHKNNSRMKLEDLLSYVDNEAKRLSGVDALANKLKIALIVLGVLLLAAIVTIVVLALKLRDAMYETYEDDEDDEEEEEEDDDEEDYRPRKSGRKSISRSKSYEDDEDDADEEDDEDDDDDDRYEDRSPRRRTGKDSARAAKSDMAHRSADEGVRRERKPEPARTAKASKASREVTYEEEDDLTVSGAVETTSKKKKNFVIDDEDFSFEFLNLD